MLTRLSIHIKRKFKKNRCFKYDEKNHIFTNDDALCYKKISLHEKKSKHYFSK